MKNWKRFIQAAIILIITDHHAIAEQPWSYTEYARILQKETVLFTLEYAIKEQYNGRVKWRITSHSNAPVYNIGIGNKRYGLLDGRTVSASAESIARKLEPGTSEVSMPDAVNSSENYGNWSDKNDNPVVSVTVEEPIIRFSLEEKGKRSGWSSAGAVVLTH